MVVGSDVASESVCSVVGLLVASVCIAVETVVTCTVVGLVVGSAVVITSVERKRIV